jgi:hypothetical protein
MNRLVVGFAAALFALGANRALAASTQIRWAQITGTGVAPTSGACSEAGYDDQCPSGSCMCVTVTGATVSGVSGQAFTIAGSGTADVFLTLDIGAEMPTGVGSCTPFFGIANLTTTRKGKAQTETLNLVGTNCLHVTGTAGDRRPRSRRVRRCQDTGPGQRRARLWEDARLL